MGRSLFGREFIYYKASMIIDEDPLWGLLFYYDLGFSHTLHVLAERRLWWARVRSLTKVDRTPSMST